MNKDCRNIWIGFFHKFLKLFELCKPPPLKIRADTDRSRCSSMLTVLSDHRRDSELFSKRHSFLFPSDSPRLDLSVTPTRSRASTLPAKSQSISVSNLDIEILVTPPPNDFDSRARCNSFPIFLLNETKTQTGDKNSATLSWVNALPEEFSSVESSHSEDSDVNSEEPLDGVSEGVSYVEEISEYSSKL